MIPLEQLLKRYRTPYTAEADFIIRFSELLQHPRAYHRDHLPGHITGSAWVVNPSSSKVLLHHHRKLDKWLQPGGHADGNANVLNVAMRELEEETGLKKVKLIVPGIFDLDIHPIPTRKDFPAHLHYDVRFLFESEEQEAIIVSDESFDVKWVAIAELRTLSDNVSLLRMAAKVVTA